VRLRGYVGGLGASEDMWVGWGPQGNMWVCWEPQGICGVDGEPQKLRCWPLVEHGKPFKTLNRS